MDQKYWDLLKGCIGQKGQGYAVVTDSPQI